MPIKTLAVFYDQDLEASKIQRHSFKGNFGTFSTGTIGAYIHSDLGKSY